jgi:hypothetical protein
MLVDDGGVVQTDKHRVVQWRDCDYVPGSLLFVFSGPDQLKIVLCFMVPSRFNERHSIPISIDGQPAQKRHAYEQRVVGFSDYGLYLIECNVPDRDGAQDDRTIDSRSIRSNQLNLFSDAVTYSELIGCSRAHGYERRARVD